MKQGGGRWADLVVRASLVLVLCAVPPARAGGGQPPSFDAVRQGHLPSEAVLLDRHGRVLHELRVDDRVRRLPWVALEGVSPALLQAVVRAEDRRFFEHGGVDWQALGGAAYDTLLRGAPRGASTLSMQVAAMLEPTLRASGNRRSLLQKFDQIRSARALEAAWTKPQILEAYLNLSPFRGELSGIGAASQGLFHKDPSGLDARESALLAALLRGPNALPEVVARRACPLADADCGSLERLAKAVLSGTVQLSPRVALAPHLARTLLSREVRRSATTIDGRLQARVLDILHRQVALLRPRNVNDAAALVLDNVTGEVVAYVGNQGEGSSAPFVDGVRAPRQAGSTLKPLLYALALEERLLTAVSLLDDSPADLVTPGGMYVPQNYDRDFRGPVSVRAALAGSLNVPAVRTLMLVGTERFAGRLRALGFEGVVEPGDYYGFSLALGSADVTLWQLTGAYRALALGGRWSPPRLVPGSGSGSVVVIDPGAAWIVSDILADRGARSATFGLDNPLATRFWSSVKTGTSKDMRDNWCIGYSRTHTVGVWVGNFDGTPMRDVSGVSGAAPAWLEIMQALTAGDVPSGPPSRPRDVTAASVRFLPALEPPREDYFLRGTEIPEVALKPPSVAAVRISYPGDGAILAVDGDIPEPVQRVRFVPTQPLDGLLWRLNDEVLQADAGGDVLWRLRPGRFELVLAAPGGGVLDRVHFEVRGGENHRESPR